MTRAASRHAAGGTIGGIYVRQIVESLGALGVDAAALRAVLDRDPSELDDPWVRLPRDVALLLFARAEELTGDHLIGLHAGQRGLFRGPLAHLFASAPRLRSALELFAHFCRIAVDTSRVELRVRGKTAIVAFHPGGGNPTANRHFVDYVLMGTIRLCWERPHPGMHPREVHLRHGSRGYGADAAAAFGCAVRFGMPTYCIVFPSAALDAPYRSASPLAAEQIERALAALPPAAPAHPTFAERVEQVARGLLVCGLRADQGEVARRLHVSVRSLQRRLEDEDTSFRTVREHVLRALVEAQLWNPALSIKSISLGLGFADVAALSKAFRRWTGVSPTAWRTRAVARAAHRGPSTGGRAADDQRAPRRNPSRVGPRRTIERR